MERVFALWEGTAKPVVVALCWVYGVPVLCAVLNMADMVSRRGYEPPLSILPRSQPKPWIAAAPSGSCLERGENFSVEQRQWVLLASLADFWVAFLLCGRELVSSGDACTLLLATLIGGLTILGSLKICELMEETTGPVGPKTWRC